MVKLLKRYSQYDETDKGTDGIPYNTMLTFPELQANPMIPRLLDLYANKGNKTLYAEKFLYFFAVLNKNTPIRDKREGTTIGFVFPSFVCVFLFVILFLSKGSFRFLIAILLQ